MALGTPTGHTTQPLGIYMRKCLETFNNAEIADWYHISRTSVHLAYVVLHMNRPAA